MAYYTERAFPRILCKTPIRYAEFNSEDFHDAIALKTSKGGVYFETREIVHPQADICIRTVDYLPDTDGPEAYSFYRAQVRWCKEIRGKEVCCGVGVQYRATSHRDRGPTYSCGLCGRYIPYGKIQIIDDFVYLCSACRKRLRDLRDGRIKNSIVSYILGNVI